MNYEKSLDEFAGTMDLFPNEQNLDLDKSRQKFHHSLKNL